MSINYAKNVGLVKMPPQVEIGGITYRTVQVNGLVWIAEDLKNDVGTYSVRDGKHYYKMNNSTGPIDAILPTGWRRAVQADYENLAGYYAGHLEKLCSTSGWNGIGTNESGLNFEQTGIYPQNSKVNPDNAEYSLSTVNGYAYYFAISGSSIISGTHTISNWAYQAFGYSAIRCCRNA